MFAVGFLVVLLLTGICVDSAVVFLGQREIANAANAAANDAVSGIDLDAYYGTGDYLVAERLSTVLAETSWKYTTHGQVRNVTVSPPLIIGPTTVEVRISGDVALVFARAFPFIPSTVKVRARSVADAQGAPR